MDEMEKTSREIEKFTNELSEINIAEKIPK
jgi:hypothetical protein